MGWDFSRYHRTKANYEQPQRPGTSIIFFSGTDHCFRKYDRNCCRTLYADGRPSAWRLALRGKIRSASRPAMVSGYQALELTHWGRGDVDAVAPGLGSVRHKPCRMVGVAAHHSNAAPLPYSAAAVHRARREHATPARPGAARRRRAGGAGPLPARLGPGHRVLPRRHRPRPGRSRRPPRALRHPPPRRSPAPGAG